MPDYLSLPCLESLLRYAMFGDELGSFCMSMLHNDFMNAAHRADAVNPGPKPSRTDAASLSDLRARRQACRVVESAAWDALLESDLTREQLVLLGAYNDSVHATRKAELDMHYTMFAKGGTQ